MTLEISVSITLVPFVCDELSAYLNIIILLKQKAPLQKSASNLFKPSFAGIIPSRFLGSILSFRPARPSAPLAYPVFSGRILIGCCGSGKIFFAFSKKHLTCSLT